MDIEEMSLTAKIVGLEWLKAFQPRLKGLRPFQPYKRRGWSGNIIHGADDSSRARVPKTSE